MLPNTWTQGTDHWSYDHCISPAPLVPVADFGPTDRLEGWAAARGYELIYAAESGNRLSMTRPGSALIHQGA